MVGDSLYPRSPSNEIIALDAETGAERWRHDPQNAHPIARKCRGVTYYRVPGGGGACSERMISATTDARLLAADTRTGRPCESFGHAGSVDLMIGMGIYAPGWYHVISAPVVVRGWVTDNQHVGEPSDVIRDYDAVTGAFGWAGDLGRPGEHGESSRGESYTPGTPNSWAPMSADEELGLVYAPLGNATPDFFGAHRTPESEKYSSPVVALDAETGELC